jgi:hypothetical protein
LLNKEGLVKGVYNRRILCFKLYLKYILVLIYRFFQLPILYISLSLKSRIKVNSYIEILSNAYLGSYIKFNSFEIFAIVLVYNTTKGRLGKYYCELVGRGNSI